MSHDFEKFDRSWQSWWRGARTHPFKALALVVAFGVLVAAGVAVKGFFAEKGRQLAASESGQADSPELSIPAATATAIKASIGGKEISLEVNTKSIVEYSSGTRAEIVRMEDGTVHVQSSTSAGEETYIIVDTEAPDFIHLTKGVLYTVVLPPENDLLSKKEYVEGETGKLELKFRWNFTLILTPRDTGNIRISSESKDLDGLRSYGFSTQGNAVNTHINNEKHVITFKYKHRSSNRVRIGVRSSIIRFHNASISPEIMSGSDNSRPHICRGLPSRLWTTGASRVQKSRR